ncbi:hypothetical protein A0U92_05005 [Acetobacter aceti]|uniref:Uncharacterized protein n=1 Tax=Acetobacter aceti TaxID=435 RepID=A0A1U9KET2_ACEAC|nr:hypothetical protein A0U92_05005 [Acetobacter aceti]
MACAVQPDRFAARLRLCRVIVELVPPVGKHGYPIGVRPCKKEVILTETLSRFWSRRDGMNMVPRPDTAPGRLSISAFFADQ